MAITCFQAFSYYNAGSYPSPNTITLKAVYAGHQILVAVEVSGSFSVTDSAGNAYTAVGGQGTLFLATAATSGDLVVSVNINTQYLAAGEYAGLTTANVPSNPWPGSWWPVPGFWNGQSYLTAGVALHTDPHLIDNDLWVSAASNPGPITLTVTSTLPPGLSCTITPGSVYGSQFTGQNLGTSYYYANAVFSGTPTVAGDYWVTFEAVAGAEVVDYRLLVTIHPPPASGGGGIWGHVS